MTSHSGAAKHAVPSILLLLAVLFFFRVASPLFLDKSVLLFGHDPTLFLDVASIAAALLSQPAMNLRRSLLSLVSSMLQQSTETVTFFAYAEKVAVMCWLLIALPLSPVARHMPVVAPNSSLGDSSPAPVAASIVVSVLADGVENIAALVDLARSW